MTMQIVPGLQSHYVTMESNGLVNGPKYHEDNAKKSAPGFPARLRLDRTRIAGDPPPPPVGPRLPVLGCELL